MDEKGRGEGIGPGKGREIGEGESKFRRSWWKRARGDEFRISGACTYKSTNE